MSKKSKFHDDFEYAPSLFIQSAWDKSQLFGMNAARDIRHFVLRGTGGCGLMKPEDAIGLRNLEFALSGRDLKDGKQRHERFSGLGLFGGTRMIRRDNPKVIVPGITEVFPAIEPWCPNSAFCGVLAKVNHLKFSPHGLVMHNNPSEDYVTIVHPNQTSCVLLQPSADTVATWDDEFKECVRIVDSLRETGDWKALLTAYNGGGVTEKEIRTWAKLGKQNPFWQVLIVNGSGRKSDELANDKEFLAEHPTVHVCENDVEDMRAKLLELGALVDGEPVAMELGNESEHADGESQEHEVHTRPN